MKKIGLICATLLAGLSLAGCNNLASQQHKASSNSSSTKAIKHHKAHKKANKKKQSSSFNSISAVSQSAHSSQQQATASPSTTQQSDISSQPEAWQDQQSVRDQAAHNGGPTTEDQARAMLGGANGDLQATRTSNGWTFSGDGYTATVNDDGTISHN
ncbi:hypothetical protein [Limosilactobacillus reuteri]|uniref:hypothetical protein n=1 Tax=Limosilactobacillus reuteri TaxID=1598 RepID=UPI00098FBCF8|nr:hypothetical protein [Limosilactobacillus reuteri]WOZ74790.1 hypothetical protein B1A73_03050 [Limosilactobacillus reuteri]